MLGNVNTSSALAAFEKMEEKGSLFNYLSASLMCMLIIRVLFYNQKNLVLHQLEFNWNASMFSTLSTVTFVEAPFRNYPLIIYKLFLIKSLCINNENECELYWPAV